MDSRGGVTRRVACALSPHLELCRRPDLHAREVVVAAWREHVICASAAAAAAGVRTGMTHRQAQQLCPDAEFLEPDPPATATLRELLCTLLYDLSPTVEVRLDGTCLIELGGVTRPTLALREMRHRVREATGADPRLGMASGPFAARVAASRARPGRLVEVPDARAFLAPLDSAELGLSETALESLALLGLRTMGQVSAMGPRQLQSQLGPEGRLAARRARGEEPDQLTAWTPPRHTLARRQFEPPLEEREGLLFVARAMCEELSRQLGLRGAGARRIRIRLRGEREMQEERAILVRHPLSSTAQLFGLAGDWLRHWQPAEPVAELVIELLELEGQGRRQLRLWVRQDGTSEELTAAIERLQDRHGEGVAVTLQPAITTSPIPIQRFRMDPA